MKKLNYFYMLALIMVSCNSWAYGGLFVWNNKLYLCLDIIRLYQFDLIKHEKERRECIERNCGDYQTA